MAKILIAFPPGMVAKMDAVAARRFQNRSDLIRTAVREYMDKHQHLLDQPEPELIGSLGTPLTPEYKQEYEAKHWPNRPSRVGTIPEPTPQHTGAFQITENKDNSLSIERDRAYNLPSAR